MEKLLTQFLEFQFSPRHRAQSHGRFVRSLPIDLIRCRLSYPIIHASYFLSTRYIVDIFHSIFLENLSRVVTK